MSRYAGALSALLLTALLFWMMPGLVTGRMNDTGRTADSLKAPKARTLVVWVTSWQPEDRSLISGLCSAFEKQRPGLRVYLRRVDAEALYAPDAVLPDAVLYAQGEIASPAEVLLPMAAPQGCPESAAFAGMHQGTGYGVPLWYSPNVLSLPKAWLEDENNEPPTEEPSGGLLTPKEQAYFGAPDPAEQLLLTADTLPWDRLLEAGKLQSDSAVGLTQLMLLCPGTLRQELSRCAVEITPEPSAGCVRSLARHLAAGDGSLALVLPGSTSQRVRYVSLCKSSEDAQAFVAFLLSEEAARQVQEKHLAPICPAEEPRDPLLQKALEDGRQGLAVPNAFRMDPDQVETVCVQDFAAGQDPVATLLKLR